MPERSGSDNGHSSLSRVGGGHWETTPHVGALSTAGLASDSRTRAGDAGRTDQKGAARSRAALPIALRATADWLCARRSRGSLAVRQRVSVHTPGLYPRSTPVRNI